MSALPGSPPQTPRLSLEHDAQDDAAVRLLRGAQWRDPSYQAYVLLRIAFVALPLAMGIDKYFNSMVYWPRYLAGWINNIIPGTAQQMMYGVGAVEILAGILIALKPRYASYIVGAWLLGIVINLFSSGKGFYDIGARDLVLMAAAFALARLAARWDPPLALESRLRRSPSASK